MSAWPVSRDELVAVQLELAQASPRHWEPPDRSVLAGGCFICFAGGVSGPGEAGEPGWAAAALLRERRPLAATVVPCVAGAPYAAGLLGLREGAPLEAAVRALPEIPEVLLVNATGRDHPRRAGLALQLGSVLGLATVGVTHRPLMARGEWPEDTRAAASPLELEGELVGYWVRTRPGTRPLAVHGAWRTTPETAVEVVLEHTRETRTPEPLREARRAARRARAGQRSSRGKTS